MAAHKPSVHPPDDLPSGPDEVTDVRLDASAIRMLAHPLRSRMLTQLRVGGPATATDLAGLLGTNTGATSYHLRKLEAVGLVRDTGEGGGKSRLWKAATSSHSWYPSELVGDPDAESALGWLSRDYLRHFAEQHERWLDVARGWSPEWQDVCGASDAMVLVTAEQLADLQRELGDVIARYRRVGQGTPSAKRVAVYVYAHPLDLATGPRR